MAQVSAPDGSVPTLAQHLGLSVEPKLSFERATEIARGLKGGEKKLAVPVVREAPLGQTKVLDLPLRAWDPNGPQQIKHVVDLVTEVPGDYDWKAISSHMSQNRVDLLPGVFAPKGPVPFTYYMQLILVSGQQQTAPDAFFLLKDCLFEQPQKRDVATPLIHGQPHFLDLGQNKRGGPKAALGFLLDVSPPMGGGAGATPVWAPGHPLSGCPPEQAPDGRPPAPPPGPQGARPSAPAHTQGLPVHA